MSYLKFEKALMTNLQESLQRELLRTNRSGAYACSTIVDCNTRKYHGLLVVPVPEIDDENHVLVSSLDVTVVQHGAEVNLSLHKYHGFDAFGSLHTRIPLRAETSNWLIMQSKHECIRVIPNSLCN